MPKRSLGIVVSRDKVVIVDANVPDAGPIVIQSDNTWPLQNGERPSAYGVMFQQIGDYVREQKIERVVIKASAVSKGTGLGHLESAELRGVVMGAAAAANAETFTIAKGLISRTFGKRKVDDYVADDAFWAANTEGKALRRGSREAVMMLLAGRGK